MKIANYHIVKKERKKSGQSRPPPPLLIEHLKIHGKVGPIFDLG